MLDGYGVEVPGVGLWCVIISGHTDEDIKFVGVMHGMEAGES